MALHKVKLKITPWDFALAGALLLLCAGVWLTLLLSPADKNRITVEVDGEIFGTYSLSEEQRIDIGGHNLLVIKDGTAYMEWADCPDKLCVAQSGVTEKGGAVICLPNRVGVHLSGKSGLDAVAGG